MSKVRIGGIEIPVPLIVIVCMVVLFVIIVRSEPTKQVSDQESSSNQKDSEGPSATIDASNSELAAADVTSTISYREPDVDSVAVSTPESLIEYFPNGHKKSVRQVRRDEKGAPINDGEFLSWSENGQELSKGSYRNGKPHGKWEYWNAEGIEIGIGEFKEGKPSGTWIEFHPNGSKAIEIRRLDGKPNGPWKRWHPNGKKAAEGEYLQGHREGTWTYWDNKEKKIRVEFYKQNKPTGKWTYWDERGNKWLETNYSTRG